MNLENQKAKDENDVFHKASLVLTMFVILTLVIMSWRLNSRTHYVV